jgi:hypothetical protein
MISFFVIPDAAKRRSGIQERQIQNKRPWIPGSLAALAPRNDSGDIA